jgi:hypothetical protein
MAEIITGTFCALFAGLALCLTIESINKKRYERRLHS